LYSIAHLMANVNSGGGFLVANRESSVFWLVGDEVVGKGGDEVFFEGLAEGASAGFLAPALGDDPGFGRG